MIPLVWLLLFFSMTGHSSATYCLCKDGVDDKALQGALDYACGNGADCSAIQPNGACYNPNTLKDHCSYAVNRYFQKNGQVPESCVFSGAATLSSSPPTNAASTCIYPSSGTGTGFGPSGSTGIDVPNHTVAHLPSVSSIFLAFFITLCIVA